MDERFKKIEQYHHQKQGKMLVSGKGVQRLTSHGYWAAAHPGSVYELFKKIQLNDFSHFLDLGSGDGMVVAIASLFTKATGIEVDEPLHKEAETMNKKLKLKGSFLCKDYMDSDISAYDFIFINPDNYFYQLEGKLKKEFKGTLVIVDNIFRPLTLVPSKKMEVLGVGYDVYEL